MSVMTILFSALSFGFPEVEKFDTNGIVLSKFDYPQFAVSTGSQLFQYSNGYILKTISMTIGDHLIRIDSFGSIVWDTQISQTTNSITSPDNNRILVASDGINLYWYDSSGAFIYYQSIPLILPGLKTMVKTINNGQQICFAGVVESGSFPTNFSAFLVQLTDTSIVSTNDMVSSNDNYIYPAIFHPGSQLFFRNNGKVYENMEITIYDSLGKIVADNVNSCIGNNSDFIINTPDSLKEGMYILKISSKNIFYVFRFIVQ